jgi:SAM-dependent methyltransferase
MNKMETSRFFMSNYDYYYEDGDSKWRWLCAFDKAKNIETLCKDLPIKSVIEIGAGEGSILKRLSDLEFAQELYALEISRTGIAAIKNKEISRLKDCSLFDGYNIPYDKKKFDLAVLSHIVEHAEYPRKLLYEAKRIAKFVFVEVPIEETIRLPQDFVFDRVGHINFYSPKTIRRLLQTCNLCVLSQKITNPSKDVYTFQKGKMGLFNFYTKEYLLKFFPVLSTKIFTYHFSIICEDCD